MQFVATDYRISHSRFGKWSLGLLSRTVKAPMDQKPDQKSERKPKRTVTLRDVAERAGVSLSTASRALSGARQVQGDLVARVQQEALALGWRPNQAARGLRTARTMTLGVLFFQLESPVGLDLLDGLGAGAQARDFSLFVASARRDQDLYETLIHRFFERRIDGLILIRPRVAAGVLDPYTRAEVPVLALLGHGPGAEHLPLLAVDTSAANAELLAAAIAAGHRVMTIVAEGVLVPTGNPNPPDRDVEVSGVLIRTRSGDRSRERLAGIVDSELSVDRPSTLFVVPYSRFAVLSDILDARGCRVPEDVSVVSYTDSRIFAGSTRIAAVHVDSVELGRRSAELLTDWIEGDIPPDVTSLKDLSSWVPGASFGPAPRR